MKKLSPRTRTGDLARVRQRDNHYTTELSFRQESFGIIAQFSYFLRRCDF